MHLEFLYLKYTDRYISNFDFEEIPLLQISKRGS